jgi:hypothetical protein
MKISTRRGNCSNIKRVTGIPASNETGMTTSNLPSITILRAAQKATIMAATEMKSVERPITNFLGNDIRKSFSE